MSIVGDKSRKLAIRMIKLYKYLTATKREFILSKQLLHSGTSIGANLAESEYAISKKDFLSKIYIALKETAETIYWLKLLHETGYLSDKQYFSVYADTDEIRRILSSTTKTIFLELQREKS